jgi:hypothetical protein
MAPLEFVMALPFILLLMVGITWLAFSVLGKAQVLVQARNDAWRERFKNLADKPLIFPSGLGDVRNPLYSEKKDYVSKTVSKKVNVSQVFDDAPSPTGSVTVLAGSWDHNAMNLNSPPSLKLYGIAAVNSATKDLQTQLSQLDSMINNMEQFAASAIAQALTRSNDSRDSGSSTESTGKAGSAQAEKEKEQKKEDLQKQQQDLGGVVNPPYVFNNPNQVQPIPGGQLDKTNDEIDRLQLDVDAKRRQPALKDEEAEKKRIEELHKAERQLQFMKDKKQRIEAQIKDNDEELKGFD